ncbi:MAG: esterase family protein [Myxococcales bacterium]|nr:esterase family protein [Myxococcales bacterium]
MTKPLKPAVLVLNAIGWLVIVLGCSANDETQTTRTPLSSSQCIEKYASFNDVENFNYDKSRFYSHQLSYSLSEERKLDIYFPPGYGINSNAKLPVVYMADGQSAITYGQAILDPLIRAGCLPAVIIVGIYSHPTNRHGEYVITQDEAMFNLHADFVLHEVIPWAERTLPIRSDPEGRIVFGFSNGGDFALGMATQAPTTFGTAIAFSAPRRLLRYQTQSRVFLLAGKREVTFLAGTKETARHFIESEVELYFNTRDAGHESSMWMAAFPEALHWALK